MIRSACLNDGEAAACCLRENLARRLAATAAIVWSTTFGGVPVGIVEMPHEPVWAEVAELVLTHAG